MCKVCDTFVIVDDASDDDTPEICYKIISGHRKTLHLHRSYKSLWSTNEVEQRKKLWEMAVSKIPKGGWIFNLDADEIPLNLEKMEELTRIMDVDWIGFRLFDMWDDNHYRDDDMWTAHNRYWYMAHRYLPQNEYVWNEQALHCGRFPMLKEASQAYNCMDLKIKHMGWSRKADRGTKYERYMEADPKGEYGILDQYQSILDDKPNLEAFE